MKTDSAMSESSERAARRELRRAAGADAVNTLDNHARSINTHADSISSLRLELTGAHHAHVRLDQDFRAFQRIADARNLTVYTHLHLGFLDRLKWLFVGA